MFGGPLPLSCHFSVRLIHRSIPGLLEDRRFCFIFVFVADDDDDDDDNLLSASICSLKAGSDWQDQER
jgi:hypothetical protein